MLVHIFTVSMYIDEFLSDIQAASQFRGESVLGKQSSDLIASATSKSVVAGLL